MSNHRAITFFDLDGTLLNAKSKTMPEVAEAMSALKENNVPPVITTGRTEVEIHFIMEDAGITSVVIMNSSFIRMDGEEIYSQTFSSEECQKMYDHVQLNGHELSYYNDQKIWCTGHSQTTINAYDFIHSDVPEIDSLSSKENIVDMLLALPQSGDEYYHEHFPKLAFYRDGPYLVDIVKKGISKGVSVKRLQKELQLEEVPTFGFGDGPNDSALLEVCDSKIAMGNVYDGLKELSALITKKNTEDGAVHVLKYFDLIRDLFLKLPLLLGKSLIFS